MKLLLIIFLLMSSFAQAKDIRLIVTFAPGGAGDRIARLMQTELASKDYNFVVEYKTGAAGIVAYEHTASIKNETVLVLASNGIVTVPLLNSNVKYDINKDFVLVKYVGIEPLFLIVKNNAGIKNYKEFVALAKTNNMPYGSAGIGSSSHIAGAIISGSNKNFIHVPYKGSSLILADLLSGVIKWEVDSDLIQSGLIADGKTKPIAVFSKSRIKKYPDVPTVKELGINDYDQYRWFSLLANASADPKIVNYVNSKLSSSEFQNKIQALGLDTTAPKNLDQFFLHKTAQTYLALKHIDLQ